MALGRACRHLFKRNPRRSLKPPNAGRQTATNSVWRLSNVSTSALAVSMTGPRSRPACAVVQIRSCTPAYRLAQSPVCYPNLRRPRERDSDAEVVQQRGAGSRRAWIRPRNLDPATAMCAGVQPSEIFWAWCRRAVARFPGSASRRATERDARSASRSCERPRGPKRTRRPATVRRPS
jgi:hypothetical protein